MASLDHQPAQIGLQYLLYCYSARGERLPPEILEASDDQMAIAMARQQMRKHCTLWHGERLVFSLPEFARTWRWLEQI